ncbi:MAG: DUF835 domain-containing protein [Methanomassiliicoccales archaeon]|jgi:hypothetical protein
MVNPIFLSLSIVVSITALAMGSYVLFRNPHLGISRAFFLVMALLSATSALDYLFISASSMGQAMLLVRLLIFCMVCMFGGFLYLAAFFSLQSDCAVFARNWARYMALVITSGAISALLFAKAEMGSYGWLFPNSPEIVGVGLVIVVYLGFALHMLNQAHQVSRDPRYGTLVAGLTLAMAIPFIYPLLVSLLAVIGIQFPSPMAPAYLITSAVFFYAIVREHLFDILPSADSPRVAMKCIPIKLEKGRSYAVEEKGTDTSFRIFASELNAGWKGVIISRRHPEQIREEYGLRNTPMIWLAHRPVKDAVSPSNLALLERTVMRFMGEGGNTVVLVEGLDKMILETSSEKAMRFLFNLEDEALVRGSRLILSFDPEGLSERDLALLMRDMVVLDHEGSVVARPLERGRDLPEAVEISLSSHRWA